MMIAGTTGWPLAGGMKWNEGESVAFLASRTPDWQGRLSYKPPKQGEYQNSENTYRYLFSYRQCVVSGIICKIQIRKNNFRSGSGIKF